MMNIQDDPRYIDQFVTSKPHEFASMLDAVGVTPTDRVLDLGSGDGRIVIAAALRGARATGIEIDPELVALSRERVRQERVDAQIIEGDLMAFDWSAFSVIIANVDEVLTLPRVRERFLATCKPGTRIVFLRGIGPDVLVA